MRIEFDPHEDQELWAEAWDGLSGLDERVRHEVLTQWFMELDYLLSLMDSCESPIEQLMGVHLLIQARIFERRTGCDCIINPQYEIDLPNGRKVRVDFLVCAVTPEGHGVEIAVECDGHEYHERTKEQARRDRSRDRMLQAQGIWVLRFTGSEIWKDPNTCAREVRAMLEGLVQQVT